MPSLPSRGAWIEIRGRSAPWRYLFGRSPHGERGLKLQGLALLLAVFGESLPSRGAWIEIGPTALSVTSGSVAPLTGSVD